MKIYNQASRVVHPLLILLAMVILAKLVFFGYLPFKNKPYDLFFYITFVLCLSIFRILNEFSYIKTARVTVIITRVFEWLISLAGLIGMVLSNIDHYESKITYFNYCLFSTMYVVGLNILYDGLIKAVKGKNSSESINEV